MLWLGVMVLWLLASAIASAEDDVLQRLACCAPGMTPNNFPSLLILGFAKAGTTDLWAQIMENYGGHLFNLPKKKEVLLSVTTREHWRYEPGAPHLRMYWQKQMNYTGGAPFTLNAAPLLLSFAYDNYWIVDQIATLSTDSNLIMLLREPVSRARSYYNWAYETEEGSHISQQQVAWDLSFAEAMTWELDLLEGIAAPLVAALLEEMAAPGASPLYPAGVLDAYRDLVGFISHAPPPLREDGTRRPRRNTLQCRSYILWSLYGPMMTPWIVRYRPKPGKLLVLQSEAFYERPEHTLSEIVAPFLFSPATHAAARSSPVRLTIDGSARNEREYLPRSYMPPAVGCRLQRFFAPFTEALMEMLIGLGDPSGLAAFVVPTPGRGAAAWWADVDYCA